jgi:hypothetical protein
MVNSVDVSRANAFRDWCTRLNQARTAISAFKVASMDPRLTASGQVAPVSDNAKEVAEDSPSLTFDELVTSIEGFSSRIEILFDDLSRARAFSNRLRNASRRSVPMHKLPTELLQMILLLSAERDDYSTSATYPASLEPYISFRSRSVLSSVCHLWHRVCAGIGCLWRHIDFSRVEPTQKMRLFIERAQATGLHLTFKYSKPAATHGWLEKCAALVTPYMTNWRQLTYHGPSSWFLETFPGFNESFGRNVKRLELRHPVALAAEDNIPLSDKFWSSFTGLVSLDLTYRVDFPCPSPANLDLFRDLTRLVIKSPNYGSEAQVDFIIHNCSKLIYLSLDDYYDPVEGDPHEFEFVTDGLVPPEDKARISMPSLSFLSLVGVSPKLVYQLFTSTSAPILRELVLDDLALPSLSEVNRFIRQSNASISTFKFRNRHERFQPAAAAEFVSLLRSFDSVRELSFPGGDIHPLITESLAVKPKSRQSGPVLCPALEEIHLEGCYLDLFNLAAMVHSRGPMLSVGHCVQLKRLILKNCSCPRVDWDRSRKDWIETERAVRKSVSGEVLWMSYVI